MQLVSRYLLSNHTVIVSDDTANLTEYRKVYQRNIKIAKGIVSNAVGNIPKLIPID